LVRSNRDTEAEKIAHRSFRRKWSNPEFIIYRNGIRLEDLAENQTQAILALVQASISETGYARVVGAMQTNEFLGELCNAKPILNKYSYQ
jgi:hypothetical protein